MMGRVVCSNFTTYLAAEDTYEFLMKFLEDIPTIWGEISIFPERVTQVCDKFDINRRISVRCCCCFHSQVITFQIWQN